MGVLSLYKVKLRIMKRIINVNIRRFRFLVGLLMFLMLQIACSTSTSVDLSPNEQTAVAETVSASFSIQSQVAPTPAPPTQQEIQALPSPTVPLPTQALPTSAPQPVFSGTPERIKFTLGATSATVTGSVTGGSVNRYVVRALKGQPTTIVLSSSSPDTYISFFGADQSPPLIPLNQRGNQWSGVLWLTQDYFIDIYSGGNPASYSLQVIIAPLPITPAV
jgi:hypothetical protein